MDTDKMAEKEIRKHTNKDAMCCIEYILETASYRKNLVLWSSTSDLTSQMEEKNIIYGGFQEK